MPYYTYVLRSLKDGRFYIGSTSGLEARVRRHNAGGVESTKHRRPLILIYSERFDTKEQARIRERHLKSLKSHSVLQEIIDNQ